MMLAARQSLVALRLGSIMAGQFARCHVVARRPWSGDIPCQSLVALAALQKLTLTARQSLIALAARQMRNVASSIVVCVSLLTIDPFCRYPWMFSPDDRKARRGLFIGGDCVGR